MKTFITKAPAPSWMHQPNYVPWLYVLIWGTFRALRARAIFIVEHNHALGEESLFWQVAWQGTHLIITIFLIWIARWLSARLVRPGLRIFVAVAAYAAVPSSVVFLATVTPPKSVDMIPHPEFGDPFAMSFLSAILALTISASSSDQQRQLRHLDRARVEILATRDIVLRKRDSMLEDLDSDIRRVVGPEVTKVIDFLKSGHFDARLVDQIVVDIRGYVETVIKPFSKQLSARVSGSYSQTLPPIDKAGLMVSWQTPVSSSAAIQPFSFGAVMFVFLVSTHLADGITREGEDLDTLRVGISSLVIVGPVVAILGLAKRLLARSKKTHTVIAGLIVLALQFAAGMLALAFAQLHPLDLHDYGSWGLRASLPDFIIFFLITLSWSISGILVSRGKDFVLERQAIDAQIVRGISLLNRDIWHLRRQGALFVHGRIQSALVATGLQLQRADLTKEDVIPLIKNLEEALGGIKSRNETALPFEDFLAQVASLWEGVMSVNCNVSASARESLASSDTLQDALREVIRESINNAVFHGGATAAEIRIERRREGTLRLRVEDNGGGPEPVLTFGLGGQLFDTVTLNWNLVREGETTVFIADFATQLSASSASN